MERHERAQKQERFVELRGFHQFSLDKCSEDLEVSKPTLIKWEKELTSIIRSHSSARFNEKVDCFELSALGRLERLRDLNKKLKNELEERDFSELSTEKLVKLYLNSLEKIDQLIDTHSLKDSISSSPLDYFY